MDTVPKNIFSSSTSLKGLSHERLALFWIFFVRRDVGVKYAQSSTQWEGQGKDRYLKKSTKPCWPIRSKETGIKYKIIGAKKKFWPHPLFRPRTDHACYQKPNASRETAPLRLDVSCYPACLHSRRRRRGRHRCTGNPQDRIPHQVQPYISISSHNMQDGTCRELTLLHFLLNSKELLAMRK